MEKLNTSFSEKFMLNELLITVVGSWIISLRPQQPTIVSLVLTLNRKCERLSQITKKEASELAVAFDEIEKMLNSTFNPDKINYLALMMLDNQVHFHVIPRYSKKILYNETVYIDSQWPGPPSLDAIELESAKLLALLNLLKR